MKAKTETRTKKLFAALTALLVAAGSTVPMAVDAATIPTIDTNFEYELMVSKVSDSRIKLTLYTTHNPGVVKMGLAMVYDPEVYTATGHALNSEAFLEGNPIIGYGNNEENGVYFLGIVFDSDQIAVEQQDYSDYLEISVILEAKDGNANDEDTTKFGAAVVDYESITEGVQMEPRALDGYDPVADPPEVEVEVTPSQSINYEYYIGDTDGSGGISLSDVMAISSVISVANSAGVETRVNILNHMIENNVVSTLSDNSTFNWGTQFSDSSKYGDFLRTVNGVNFACVESADATQDGLITTTDRDAVLDCYSAIGSSLPVDKLFTDSMTKTVYY